MSRIVRAVLRSLPWGTGALAVIAVAASGVHLYRASRGETHVLEVESRQLFESEQLARENERGERLVRSSLITANPRYIRALDESRQTFDSLVASLSRLLSAHEGVTALERLRAAVRSQREVSDRAIATRRTQEDPAVAERLFEGLAGSVADLDASVAALGDLAERSFESARRQSGASLIAARSLLVMTLGVAATLGAIVLVLARHRRTMIRRNLEFERHLAGVVCHDLRTPLAAILLTTEGLAASVPAGTPQRSALDRVTRSAERMSRLTQGLLEFTRSRFGSGVRLAPRCVDVLPLCEHAIAEVQASAPNRVFVLRRSESLTALADPDRFEQALVNLLRNAVEHGPTGTAIEVRAFLEGRAVRIEVCDHGFIAGDALRKVAAPLRRRGQPTPKADGVGLGLFIAGEIVRAHGGRLSVRSRPEEGTVFAIELRRMETRSLVGAG